MKSEWFTGIDEIVSDDFRFKSELNIGEDAYKLLKAKKTISGLWDVFGAATTGAQIAGSSVVASHFFSAGGILGIVGIGTAATPIGWIFVVAALAAGGWFGITRYFKAGNDKIKVVPNFINTPLDVLALSLFDLIAPLSMKVAAIDGHIADEEIETTRNYFIKDWGYSKEFTDQGLEFIRDNIEKITIKDIATALATFTRDNPDCNFTEMTKAILTHLNEIAAADGRIHERETLAIQEVGRIFEYEDPLSFSRHLETVKSAFTSTNSKTRSSTSTVSKTISSLNFRAGPSTHFNIVTTVSKGNDITITDRAIGSDWVMAKHTNIDGTQFEGYVFRPELEEKTRRFGQ